MITRHRSTSFVAAMLAACLATVASAATAPAPAVDPAIDHQVEAARSELYARKAVALKKVMQLSAEQQAAFNPVLKAYDDELRAIGDRRIALIKEFAAHYDAQSLDEATAKRLVDATFKLKHEQLKLLETYFPKATKAIGMAKASEWLQLENAFMATIDAKLSLLMPAMSEAMK